MEGLQLFAADARDGVGSAFAGMAIGVLAIQALEQFQVGQLAGVLLLLLETGQQLVLDPRQGILGEGGLAQHLVEKGQGRFALFGRAQAAQAGHRHIAVGTVAKLGTQVLEGGGDGADILARYPFVEHGIGQHGQAGNALVMAAAGGEGQAQVEHRQFASLHEQHLGTLGGRPGLDLQMASGRGLITQLAEGFDLWPAARLFGRLNIGAALAGGIQDGQQNQQRQTQQAIAQTISLTYGATPRAVRGRRSNGREQRRCWRPVGYRRGSPLPARPAPGRSGARTVRRFPAGRWRWPGW